MRKESMTREQRYAIYIAILALIALVVLCIIITKGCSTDDPNDTEVTETTTSEFMLDETESLLETESVTEIVEEITEVSGMTDEEIINALWWGGYGFETVDQMRAELWNSEMALYTEDEVALMSNEEAYYAFIAMIEIFDDEVLGEETESVIETESETEVETTTIEEETTSEEETETESYNTIYTSDEFDEWYENVSDGDTVTIEAVVTIGTNMSKIIQCKVYNGSRNDNHYTYFYLIINDNDGNTYKSGDLITVTCTFHGKTWLGTPYFDAESITVNS